MTTTLDGEVADLRRANAELQQRLDEALAERDEAQAQKAAMAEVLEVINASPGDLEPVFDAMLEKAMRLCEAAFGGLWTFDGDRYVSTALRGVPSAYAEFLAETTLIPGPGSAPYRFLRGERDNAFAVRRVRASTSCISPPRVRRHWTGFPGRSNPPSLQCSPTVNTPGMDGLELLGEIKQRRPDLPVMMVTAYGDDERRRRARELGGFEFITKPVDFDHLKEQLRQLPAATD